MPASWQPDAVGLGLALAAVLLFGQAARASDAAPVRMLAAGAVQGAILKLQPAIIAAAGHKLDITFDTVGALRDRVLAGEAAELIILSAAGMAALEKAGKVAPGSAIDLGSIAVSLAVRKDAAVPDLASPQALKTALLAAVSIAYADPARGATAGTHFARVLELLAIAAEVRARVTVLRYGGDVIEAVAQGRFELGVSQSSEIVAHPGVALAGPLPAPYDQRTHYLAARLEGAPARAEAVLGFLRSAAARSQFAALGFAKGPLQV
jgi:molybdate transport system substrate-binding protein